MGILGRIAAFFIIILGALALIGAALTQSSIATPVARSLMAGRSTAEIERAWLSYDPWPVAHIRNVEIEGGGHIESMDARLNLFGVLPGIALITRLGASDGALLLELGPSRSSQPPGILSEIAIVDLQRIRLDIHRPERAPQVIVITSAQGDIDSGDLEMQAEGGDAVLSISGRAGGLSLAGFEGDIRLEGENFAVLAALLGFAAPDTPRYALEGALARTGETWRFGPFAGEVGDSDLSGSINVDFAGERPFMRADLTSGSLDFDDLGVIIGAPSDVEDGAPNQRQEEIAARYRADANRAIPETALDVSRLTAVDADVSFQAETVRAGPVPLDAVEMRVRLDNAVLRIDPLIFAAPQGRLESELVIDAQDRTNVHGTLTGALSEFDLEQLAGGRLLRGDLTAEFDLAFQGARTRQAFASLTGEAAMWSTSAELRAVAEEAAGLDLGEIFTLSLNNGDGAQDFRPAQCAVARMTFANGRARLNPAVIDTEDSVTRINGDINLETEELDLEVETDAQDFSWGALLGGASVGGTLRDPDVNVPLGEATLQIGAAALLGGLTAGLAALPFIEPGLAEDAPCAPLMQRARAVTREVPDEPAEDAPG